jgi:SMODS and SLOG-associating 2TM effector domain family 5
MSKEIEYYKHLVGIMYKTRGCRFGAASALEIKERWSVGAVAFLSAYVLSWSIVLLSYSEAFSSKHASFYTALSAIASISLLVISLMDYAFGRSVQAEKLHQNALEISACMRELERQLAAETPDVGVMERIATDYERHISETQINHTTKDFIRWNYSSAKPKGYVAGLWYPLRHALFNVWFYLSSMFIHAFLIFAIVASTIWYTVRFVIPGSFWQ